MIGSIIDRITAEVSETASALCQIEEPRQRRFAAVWTFGYWWCLIYGIGYLLNAGLEIVGRVI